MFVDEAELRETEIFAESMVRLDSIEEQQHALSEFFYHRLHMLLPCGFDEIRYTRVEVQPAEGDVDRRLLTGRVGSVRHAASGAWYNVVYGTEPRFLDGHRVQTAPARVVLFPAPFPTDLNQMLFIPLSDIIAAARAQPDHTAAVVLPALWLPPREHPTIELVETTKTIVASLRAGATSLADLTWRQLEELVAELLRTRGLRVEVTARHNDGGRDIIARGELIPGEPGLLAVEVKHRRVVNVGEAREALYANRQFPMVMLATSGRFAAGVLRERSNPDNRFRLLLKDGVALTQWIRENDRHRGA